MDIEEDFQVLRVRVQGRLHTASESYLIGDSMPLREAVRRARQYWLGVVEETDTEEIIFEGRLRVEEVMPLSFYEQVQFRLYLLAARREQPHPRRLAGGRSSRARAPRGPRRPGWRTAWKSHISTLHVSRICVGLCLHAGSHAPGPADAPADRSLPPHPGDGLRLRNRDRGSRLARLLGLIVGGIVALEVARVAHTRGLRLHYPLLVASAYSGYVIWHMGYSGSGPLAAAAPGSFLEDLEFGLVPITQTTFSTWNIIAAIVTLAVVTGAMVLLRPRSDDEIVELADRYPEEEEDGSEATTSDEDAAPRTDSPDTPNGPPEEPGASPSPAQRVDGARVLTLALGLALVLYLLVYFAQEGFALTLDIVNWSFLAAILLIVGSPCELVELITEAGRTVGNVLLQYPLYVGILGMMSATGLVEVFSQFFVNISTPGTLSTWAMISGGIVNFFVPSGGGQFAIQGPIFLEAAERLGTDPAPVIMGVAYGDQWTNMIQPFWTIPILAIAGLSVRDIMGYTTITLFISGIVMVATLLIVGAG